MSLIFKSPCKTLQIYRGFLFTNNKKHGKQIMDDLTKIANSVLANQFALNCNDMIRRTPYYKKNLKNKLNLLMPELIEAEKTEYDKLFQLHEGKSVLIYDIIQSVMSELSEIGIHNFAEINEVVKAYKKDPKSVMGIAKKVNQ